MVDREMPLFSSARTVAAAKACRVMEDVGYFLYPLFFGGFFKFSPGIKISKIRLFFIKTISMLKEVPNSH